jgi:hypothetical protein
MRGKRFAQVRGLCLHPVFGTARGLTGKAAYGASSVPVMNPFPRR